MIIRPEQANDQDAIASIVAAAFAQAAHSRQTEPAIIAALRDAGALTLSLVAVGAGEIVGHAAFSPVMIDGRDVGWHGLGPLAVRPDRQGQGIGAALVREGLDRLRASGAAGCVVLGEPDYYRRFGFRNDDALRYEGAPAAYFMSLSFTGHSPDGRVEYHPGFGAE
ncbi:GNAT family N-acetyltransferase [Paracoccus luteus]|uniref:GNAT family N-acetyltransferase n=1 Tax=Paracoccus luteus TaxID=2508543 RepID=UPI00106F7862|nr:N-acetyltransferase [Paracoccus luteus]